MESSNLTTRVSAILFVALFCICGPVIAQGPDLSLGSIEFPNSRAPEAQEEFITGVLALHSFWYPEARDHFRRAREIDPDFAMAYWGEAMTYDHPLWQQHDQSGGAEVLEQLDERLTNGNVKSTEQEKMFLDAIRILYDSDLAIDERRKRYAGAMQELYEKYPNDETLAFSALASMSAPSFEYDNPDVRDVVPIASKLEILYQRNPEHPGAMHYLIHVYDNEKFAEMGLRPADDYSKIAYSSPHAIHMPSHIFKQLEMWDKVIEANTRAYEASVEWQEQTGRPINQRDFHSYRWLFEAYVQAGKFEKACSLLDDLQKMETKAREKREDPGRIPSLINRFRKYYNDHAGESVKRCG